MVEDAQVTIDGIEFCVHQEPSMAQKEESVAKFGHDECEGMVYPWWAEADGFAGGPYPSRQNAIEACQRWATQQK